MAIKIDGAKKKAKVSRDPIFADEKAVGTEPVWDTARALEFSDEEFDHNFRKSMKYYNYFYSTKDLKKYFVEWLRKHQGNDSEYHHLDKATIDYYAKTKDGLTPLTACAIVKAHTQGMPLRDRHVEYLLATVKKVIALAEETAEEDDLAEAKVTASKIAVKAPTIQDRMNEIALTHRLHFEELEDQLFAGATVDPKAYDYLLAKNVPQAMLGKIVAFFERHRDEIVEAKTTKDEDLKEAYSHYKAADFKRHEAFYTALLDGFTQYGQVKKATKKASVRKPPAKEKLVAKLKYLKTDTATKAVSINPVDIIGAQVLWVYNSKTRKLGKYVAEDMGGALNVKGTTITGYDELKSVSKTLRKPEQQIKEFLAAGKIDLRKFLESIKSTEVKLNGRINQDTILLKVQ
jgi:hypothetical protein